MHEYLIAIGLFFFTLLVFLRREYGIYLIILLLPAYQIRFSIFGIPATFLEGMILILAAASLQDMIKFRGSNPRRLLPVGLFLFAALLSIFVSPLRLAAAGIWKAYFFEAVLFYFLVRTIINTPQKLTGLWRTITLLVFYLSLFGIYQYLTLAYLPVSWWEINIAGRRIISVLNHPNALALLLGPLLAILIFLPQKTRLTYTAIALGLINFYLTLSRAGWLALLVAVVAAGLFTSARKKILAGAALLALLVVAIPFSRQKLLELTTGRAATQENRYVLWIAAFDLIKKHPLTGTGLMGFHEAYKNYPLGPDRVVQNYPHNFFLNFWLETGLLGLLAVVWLLVSFYKKIRALFLRAETKSLALAIGAGMLVILLHGLVDVPYFKNDLSILFWLILSLPELSA